MRSLSLVSGQPLLNKIGVTGSLGGARAMYVAMLWYGQVNLVSLQKLTIVPLLF